MLKSEKPKKSKNQFSSRDSIPVFDTVDVRNVVSKADILSQNPDTSLSYHNYDDTRPYEQKNISKGFHKTGKGSK